MRGHTVDPSTRSDFDRRLAAAAASDNDGEEDDRGGLFGAIDDAWDWTAPGRHAAGNATSGFTNELTFGTADLGGDKNSAAYKTGQGASYVPWNPASALKSLGIGTLKVGGKVFGKEAIKKNADDVAGAGGRGGSPRGLSNGVPIPPPKRWGPHNGPGPGEKIAKTFRSASYTERVLEQDTYLYRAWGDEKPGHEPLLVGRSPSRAAAGQD